MTWKQKTVARILLIIARMLAEDPDLVASLKTLATEIQVSAPAPEPAP